MRTLVGRAPALLARRWLRVERLAMVTLHRDQFADEPGPSLSLALGERTGYRAGAWLLDAFARPDGDGVGTGYAAPVGFGALALVAGGVEPAALDTLGGALHALPLPRDQWAALTIGALDGDATVGLLLRATPAGDGYLVRASPNGTECARLTGGVAGLLASVPTLWRAGDVLRVEAVWSRLRVYRDAILVLDTTDGDPRLDGGSAGLAASATTAEDRARIASWSGGARRHEYLGAVLDMGDVQSVLGQPVAFDVALSNLAPMGGASRFAALLRHGLNTDGTYDLDRGTVRIYTALDDAEGPLDVAEGRIDAPGELTEDRVRLVCRGRDAFLTPRLDPGPVTYLPGPPPSGAAPVPADPCADAMPPDVIPGPTPTEPPAVDRPDGIGPEAPAREDAGPTPGPPTLYVVQLQGYPPPAVPEMSVEVTSAAEWSEVIDGPIVLNEASDDAHPGNPPVQRNARSLFRAPGWPGSHVTGVLFPGVKITVLLTYRGGPPATSPPTSYPFPAIKAELVEYGVPNPDYPDPANPDAPAFIRPVSPEQIEAFVPTLTWAAWQNDAAPWVLSVIGELVLVPAGSHAGQNVAGQPDYLGIITVSPYTADPFGLPIGDAAWVGIRCPLATRTPVAPFTSVGPTVGVSPDSTDTNLTIGTPPPDEE